MEILLFNILLGISVCFNSACSKNESDLPTKNNWKQVANMGNSGFRGGASFTIGNYAYVVGGMYGGILKNTVWQYDSLANTWIKKSSFPGTAVVDAVAFSIGSKGYLFTGVDDNVAHLDFWEYNAQNDSWTKKSDYPGVARSGACVFVIDQKAYVFSGSETNDVWEFNPQTENWIQKADFPGTARAQGVSFVIGGKGYFGTGGLSGSTTFLPSKDFWEFDPITNIWTKKNDFPGEARAYGKGFSVGTRGYLGLGITNVDANHNLSMVKDFWEYNPLADQWLKIEDFAGQARGMSTGFVLGTSIFIGSGCTASYQDLCDCWRIDIR